MKKERIKIGDPVPRFSLLDQHGEIFSLVKFLGRQKLVIYFYPKDESRICTKEACAFRDSYQEFEDAGALIIGINAGSVESHRRFASKHRLNFTLLSDTHNLILKKFGVRKILTFTGRETFVVGLSGRIQMRYSSFLNSEAHVRATLNLLQSTIKLNTI
jgi:peroxiredoxin Q/BCP